MAEELGHGGAELVRGSRGCKKQRVEDAHAPATLATEQRSATGVRYGRKKRVAAEDRELA
jgi:hypothetical protein